MLCFLPLIPPLPQRHPINTFATLRHCGAFDEAGGPKAALIPRHYLDIIIQLLSGDLSLFEDHFPSTNIHSTLRPISFDLSLPLWKQTQQSERCLDGRNRQQRVAV